MGIQSFLNSQTFVFIFNYGQTVALGVLLLAALFVWLGSPHFLRRRFLVLIAALALAVRVLLAVGKSYAQYYIWAHSPLGKLFLPPYNGWSYYFHYVGTHFWFETGIAVLIALAAYLFFWGLRRYRERFFEGGEAELGLILCLMIGWPGVLVFIAGTCIGIVVVSAVRGVWLAQAYTTLGVPMLIGGVLAFVLNRSAFIRTERLGFNNRKREVSDENLLQWLCRRSDASEAVVSPV